MSSYKYKFYMAYYLSPLILSIWLSLIILPILVTRSLIFDLTEDILHYGTEYGE